MTDTSISLIQKLEDDVWGVIKVSDVYNANLHAVKERLAKIKEKAQSELDTLEAVKAHRENFRHSSYIEWLRELDNILEGETLQNIGDNT